MYIVQNKHQKFIFNSKRRFNKREGIMKKTVLTALAALTLTVISSTETPAFFGKSKDKDVRLGFTVYKYDDNFMALVRQSIEGAGRGVEGVKILMNDSQNDQSKQNDQVDILLSKGVDALAINLVDPAAAATVIRKAKADNVPIVFYNKEPSAQDMASYDKAFYVGTTSAESGIIQGNLISKQWNENVDWDLNKDGKLQYVMLKGEPGHPDAEARTRYSIKTIVDNKIEVEELHMDTAMWDTAQAKDKMEAWLSGPNGNKIEVIICNNDAMALGAIEAAKANGKAGLPIFGVDALSEALVKIGNGEMAGTVLNDAPNQGQATFDLTYNLAKGREALEGTEWKLDDTKAVRVPYVGVDASNLEEFK